MAERFNLTAQLQLQAPTNTGNVANQIRRDLGNINVNVDVQANNRSMSGINNSLQSIRSNAAGASKGISTLNRNLAESARRFSVITVATGTFIAFARSIKNSIGNAIQFEREMVKISQVTGRSVTQLQGLSNEVTRISKNFGVANQSLLETARVLTQAGLNAKKTKEALQVLANTTLAPTFDNIRDTAEGAIAILNQFGREAAKVGQDIKFLEQSLDAINAVSKRFAVESSDLITAVRRTGGVFEAAGGSLNELVALFTSVRATTRESAETIATGFRTIFTRIQRTETIDQLKQLGIELTDLEGKFIGPMKAIEALSVGLAGLDPRDTRFNEIVEQLGGFRQIGKVIPLLKQFATAQNALSVANSATGSTARDALIAQQALSVQFQKVKEQFDALVRTLAGSDTFRGLATTAIELASAFLKFAESLERVLPQLTTLAALKIGRNIAPGLLALAGGRGRATGGPVSRFASGGMVPGTGNRDTVPAMLTPGEFVIRKSSVKKLGADKLQAMNNNRYASGGMAKIAKIDKRTISLDDGDTFSAKATPATDKFEATFRTMGYDAYETGNKDSRVSPKRYNEIKKYNQKNKKFLQAKQTGSGGGAGFRVPSNTIIDSRGTTATRAADLATGALKGILGKKKNLQELVTKQDGGFGRYGINVGTLRPGLTTGRYQRFSLGGIANVSRVGAAILQEDQGAKNQQFNVGVKDVQKAVGGGSGAAGSKLRKGVGAQFKGKQYTLVAQGLGQKTSEGFREALIDGVAVGLDSATGSLGADLGLGQATLDPASRNEFKSYVGKRPMVGDLFEAALSSLSGKGVFKESQVSAPFDFPGGLSGTIADNYNKLPSSWVDARSSFAQATASAFKTKVANELGDEYKRQFASRDVKEAAKGGSTSGTDTVPALLTPGEFVFSKSSAQRIGYANLDRMNKKGVTGYASGGPVMLTKGGDGGLRGGTGSRTFGDSFGSFGELISATVIKEVEKALQFVSEKMMEAGNAISNLDKVSGKLVKVMSTLSTKLEEQSKTTQQSNNKDKADLNAETKEASTKGGGEKSGVGRSRAQMGQLNKNIIANGRILSEIDGNTSGARTVLISINRKAKRIEDLLKGSSTSSGSDGGDTEAKMDELAPEFQQLGKIICDCILKIKPSDGPTGGGVQTVVSDDSGSSGGGGGGGLKSIAGRVGRVFDGVAKTAAAPFRMVGAVAGGLSSALQKASSGLIALAFVSGTVVQAMGNISEAQKEQIQAGLNSVSVFAAIGAEILSFGLAIVGAAAGLVAWGIGLAAQTAGMMASAVANVALATVTGGTSVSMGALATSVGALLIELAPLVIIVGVVTIALAALVAGVAAVAAKFFEIDKAIFNTLGGVTQLGFMAYTTASEMERLKQSAEGFNRAADELIDNVAAGRGGSREDFVSLTREAAIANLQEGAISARQFTIPGLQGSFEDLEKSLFGQAFTRGSAEYERNRRPDATQQQIGDTAQSLREAMPTIVEASVANAVGGKGLLSSITRLGAEVAYFADGVAGSASMAVTGADWSIGGFSTSMAGYTNQVSSAVKETFNLEKQMQISADILKGLETELELYTKQVGAVAEGFAGITYDSTQALYNFNEALKRAETEGLDPLSKAEIRATGTQRGIADVQGRQDDLRRLSEQRRSLLKELQDQNLYVGEEEVEGDRTQLQEQQIAREKLLRKEEMAAREAIIKELDTYKAQEAALRQDILTATGERVQEIAKSGDISGFAGFKDLGNIGPEAKEFQTRLKALTQALKDSVAFGFDQQIEQEQQKKDPNEDLIKNLEAQRAASVAKSTLELERSVEQQILAAKRVEKARVLEELSLIANQKALDDVNQSLKGLNKFLLGNSRAAEIMANLDNELAAATGQMTSAIQINTDAFDIPLEQLDMESFNKMLQDGVGAMTGMLDLSQPIDQAVNDRVKRMADTLRLQKFLVDEGRSLDIDLGEGNIQDLLGLKLDKVGEDIGIDQQIDKVFKSIIDQLNAKGFDTDLLSDKIRNVIDKALREDGEFGSEDFKELTSVIGESADELRNVQKAYIEQINKFSDNMNKLNKAVIDASNKLAEASGTVVDVQERGLNRIAEFTGQARNRDEIERGRTRAAQARLGPDARGFGARAGNVQATLAAAKEAKAAQEQALKNAKAASEQGDFEGADGFNNEAQKAANAYKRSTDELKRMTDQSARASDAMAKVGELQEKLEKLKSAFDQTKNFLQNFAFATNEQRGEMLKGFQDLGNAMRQGSLRGATGEQRQRIGGLLDQLSDVTFATGETGAQMKGRFATQELIDMGFDPQFAAIAGQEFAKGPIQKQILNELKVINAQEEQAARALADLAAQELDATKGVRDELKNNFKKDLRDAIVSAFKEGTGDAEARRAREEKLNETLGKLDSTIPPLENSINNYTDKIGDYTATLKNLIEARQQIEADAVKTGTTPAEKAQEAEEIARQRKQNQEEIRKKAEEAKLLDKQDKENIKKGQTPKGTSSDPVYVMSKEERRQEISRKNLRAEEMRRKGPVGRHHATGGRVGYFNRGGKVEDNALMTALGMEPKGTDTIPTMLTPGEFVINAKTAKKIGYGKLNRINYMKRGGRAGGANNQMDPMFGMVMRLQRMGLPVGPQSKGGIDPRTFFTKGDKELIKQFGAYSEQQVREINRLGYFTQEQSDMLRKAGFNPENIVLDPATQKIFEDFGKQISPELVKALTTGTLGQDPGKNLFDPKSFTNPLQGPLQQSANAAGQSSKLLLDLIQCVCGETELTKSILDEQKKQTQQKASDAFKSAWESVKKGFGGLFEGIFGGGSGSSSGGGAGPTKGLFGMRGARFTNRAKYGLGTGSRDSRAVRARRLGQGTPRYLQFPFGSGARQGMFMPGGGGGFGGGAAGGATGGGKSVMQNFKDAIKSFQSGVSALAAGGGRSSRDSLLSVMQDIRQLIAKLVECTCGVMIDFSSVSSMQGNLTGDIGRQILSGFGSFLKDPTFGLADKAEQQRKKKQDFEGSVIGKGAKVVGESLGKANEVVADVAAKGAEKAKQGYDYVSGLLFGSKKEQGKEDPNDIMEEVEKRQIQKGKELGGPYDRSYEAARKEVEERRAVSPGNQVFGDMDLREQPKPTGGGGFSIGGIFTDPKPLEKATEENTKAIEKSDTGSGAFGTDDFKPFGDLSYSMQDLKDATIATVAAAGEIKPNMVDEGPRDPIKIDPAVVERIKSRPSYGVTDPAVKEERRTGIPSKASFRMQELEKIRSDNMYVSSAVSMDEINKVKAMSDEEFNQYRQDPQKAYEDQLTANRLGAEAYDKRDMSDTSGLFAGQTKDEKEALRRAGTGVKSQTQLDSQMQSFIDATKAATDAYNNDPRVKAGTKASEMSKQDRQEVAAKRKAMKAAEAQEKAEASRLRKENQKAMEFDDPQANALRRGRAMAGTETFTDPLDKYMSALDATEKRRAEQEKAKTAARDHMGPLPKDSKYDETGALRETHTQDQVRELRRMDSNMRTSATRFLQTGDGIKSTKFDRDDKKPIPIEDKTKGKQGDSGFMGMIRGAGSFLGRLMGGPVKGRRSSAEVRKMKVAQAAQAGGPNRMMQMQLTKQDSVLSVLQDIRGILAQCCGVSGGGGMGGGMFGGGGGVVAQQFPTGPPQTDPRYAPDQYQYGMSSFAIPSQIPNAPPMGGGGMFGPGTPTPETGMQMDLTGITGPICDCVNNLASTLLLPLQDTAMYVGQMASQFQQIFESLNTGGTDQTAQAAGPFEMNHTFSGELTVAVKMPDGAAQQIQEVLGKSLQTYLEDKVPEWVKGIKDEILGGNT